MSARLKISLAALTQNYQTLCACAPGSVAAVVKADAYGLGVRHVATALAGAGCEEFFVATLEEALALRAVLADARIYVLNGLAGNAIDTLLSHRLIPVLNSPQQCQRWLPSEAGCAVHVDTGMQRLGLNTDEFLALDAALRVELIVSHLARADEPEHPANALQIDRFSNIRAHAKRWSDVRFSCNNSAGTLQGLASDENLARAGIALYGGNPFVGIPNPMACVVQLEAQVLQVREIAADSPFGYGGVGRFAQARTLAIVGAGYADGVPRVLGDRGAAWFENRLGSIVGRVSMDSVHVYFEGDPPGEGDWVELLGPQVQLDAVAASADTIGYEILTNLSTRAKRTYVEQLLE